MSARLYPAFACALTAVLTGCASPDASIRPEAITEPNGSRTDTSYLLAPGDRVDVIVHSAPELSRELVIAPDGLVRMPLAGPVMAMARTPEELAVSLSAALAGELIDPDLDVVTIGFAAPRVFVGGEVLTPGIFDLAGPMEAADAISMAGGVTRDALPDEALLIRRLPGGEVDTIRVSLLSGLAAGTVSLRGFDVVYVPDRHTEEQGPFARQYIRDTLPLPFQLFYDVSE